MKRSQLILATIALPIDYLMLVSAGVLAYQIRFIPLVRGIRPVVFQLPFETYMHILLIVSLVLLLLFSLAGLYSLNSYLKFSQEVGRVFLACTASLALIILVFFFNPTFFSSRFIVLVAWLCAFLLVSFGRLMVRLLRTALYKRGWAVSRVLLIGSDATALALENLFYKSPGLGFKVVRRMAVANSLNLESDTTEVDEVIVGDPNLSREATLNILEFCSTHHLSFKYAADMLEAQSHNVVIHTLAGVPLIEIKRTPLDGWGRIAKRIFDILVSLLMFIILLPLFIILTLLVYFDSGWPIIVSLDRVGESGRNFRLYKFRSMVQGADKLKDELLPYNERADGPLFKMSNDPRVTNLGKALRRTSLDELPQLWNVLRGEMSLVGPRPHEPQEVAHYQSYHHKLLNIKPGITGMAQISGRSNLNFEDEAKLDTFYVENWSLWTDFVILIKTLVVVWQRKAAV